MLRVLLLFLALAAIAAAAAWFADHPGDIALTWGQYRIETTIAVAGAALLVVLIAVLALYRLWRWLVQRPTAWRQRRAGGRQRRGYEVLTQGLIAVAAGDSGQGRKLARRADTLLEGSPLTLLLSAQAAQLDGDDASAKRHFEALRAIPDTAFLGVRGLLVLAKREGEAATVRRLAEEAFRLRPDAAWAANELYLAQAMDDDWDAAARTVEQAGRRKKGNFGEAERRRAVALYGQACAAEAAGEPRRALERALKAVAQAPGFVPAAALAVRLHAASGDRRKAQRLLADAWRRGPHPELAAAFAEMTSGEDAAQRLKAAERLAQSSPGDDDSHLLIAAHAIEAEEWETARSALAAVLENGERQEACLLQARLVEREGGEGADVQRWLARAAGGPLAPSWHCGTCGWGGAWQAICPNCGDFDSLSWGRPPGEAASLVLGDAGAEEAPEDVIAPPAEMLQMDETQTPAKILPAREPAAGD